MEQAKIILPPSEKECHHGHSVKNTSSNSRQTTHSPHRLSHPLVPPPERPALVFPAGALCSASRAASAGVAGESPCFAGAPPPCSPPQPRFFPGEEKAGFFRSALHRTEPIWSFPDGGQPELALPVVNLVHEAGRRQQEQLAAQQPPLPPPAKTEQRSLLSEAPSFLFRDMGMEHLMSVVNPSSGYILQRGFERRGDGTMEEMKELQKQRTERMMEDYQNTESRDGAIRCPIPRKSSRLTSSSSSTGGAGETTARSGRNCPRRRRPRRTKSEAQVGRRRRWSRRAAAQVQAGRDAGGRRAAAQVQAGGDAGWQATTLVQAGGDAGGRRATAQVQAGGGAGGRRAAAQVGGAGDGGGGRKEMDLFVIV